MPKRFLPFYLSSITLGASLLLCGCASSVLTSYNASLTPVLQQLEQGDAPGAAANFSARNNTKSDVLFLLEQGEFWRNASQFDRSNEAWLNATQLLNQNDLNSNNPQQWLDNSLQYVLNDKAKPYAGHDFERVLMGSRLALNYIAQGRWDDARVEIKKSHELEAQIAEQETLRNLSIEEKSKEKRVPSWADIGGYPVQMIDAPEVLALKNSYQSAISHFLAGFVYEARGEKSLAAAGYRQAIELQPNQAVLENSLRDLDIRPTKNDGKVDVVILVEAGLAPARMAQNFTLPLPYRDQYGYWNTRLASMSFPTLSTSIQTDPVGWRINQQELPLNLVTDTSLMSRRALRDEMPMILLRSTARAVSRWAISSTMDRKQSRNTANGGDLGLALVSALFEIGGAITEQADDRCWRSLPGRFYLARLRLAPGRYTIKTSSVSELAVDISTQARQQMLVLRWLGSHLTRIQ